MGRMPQSLFGRPARAARAKLLAAATFLAAANLLPATPAMAQGAVKSVHGDWQIRCDTPPGAQGEQCALIQSVVAEDRSNAGLTVIILKTADQKSKLMRVVAPLGVLLPDDAAEWGEAIPQPRRKLAAWITDPHNPLTARVLANRLWQ